MKKIIRLTENDIHRMVMEAISNLPDGLGAFSDNIKELNPVYSSKPSNERPWWEDCKNGDPDNYVDPDEDLSFHVDMNSNSDTDGVLPY